AQAARGSVEARARVAERVAQTLAAIANPYEFDLLARKAAAMIGVSEELLRREARKGARARRQPTPPPTSSKLAAEPLDAAAEAESGLVAIALRWPELRAELRARLSKGGGGAMRSVLLEICASPESQTALEMAAMNRMSDAQRGKLSALMVGSLISDESASRGLIEDYLRALATRQRRDEVEELRRAAASGAEDDAAAAAQAVIAIRRQANRS
ncbi:MAG: hypothetical protein ACREQT_03775, partial [Candidatus Binataceae bacterium]